MATQFHGTFHFMDWKSQTERLHEKNISLFYSFGSFSLNIHVNNIIRACFVATYL